MRLVRSMRLLGAALVVGGGLVATTTPPAGAATTTIKATGATLTRTDASAGTTLTVKATVARLDLWCSSNKLVVNKKATAVPCNKLLSVTTTGLTGNDWVEINATSFGSSLPKTALTVKTGAGNDTINIRHRSTLTVHAGAGNDVVAAGFAAGLRTTDQVVRGDDGNDKLTNLGELESLPTSGPHDPGPSRESFTTLDGGLGADRFLSDPNNSFIGMAIVADLDDSIETGTNFLRLSTGAGNDTIKLHSVWAKGLTVTTTRVANGATRNRTFTLNRYIQELTVDTQGGNDVLALTGDVPTPGTIELIGGTGSDSVSIRYTDPCTNDAAKRVVTCDLRTIAYGADIEKVSFAP
jgi:hypothetical protein